MKVKLIILYSKVFESSSLFESGHKFSLRNFEHVVTHLEKEREKINFHLKPQDKFIEKVKGSNILVKI